MNAEPHLGHAYTTIVGDALTRWHRLLGDDVKYLTGTDEHGLKIQQAAEAAGVTPQEFTDEIAPKFAAAWERLDITNDDFIRTTEPRHKAAVAELLQRCYDAGDIELDTFAGKYCVACEEYYADDELITVDGTDDCCPIHQRPVEYFEEENYFFRLSRFEDRLLDWYAAHPTALTPEHRGNEALGLIRGGLRDFSVSRTSLEWGIPLPWDSEHVTYVWFDALTNYLAAVGFGDGTDGYRDWWPVDYHLIGKDIVRQHCVYWPAMLMSAGVEPPKGWAIGGWLLSGGEKMSKTSGNVVNPLDLIDDGRSRRLPLLRARRHAVRQRRRLHDRGPHRPLQLRSRQQPRQPARPGRDGGREEVRRHRYRTGSRQPAGRGRRSRVRRDGSRAGTRSSRARRSTPRGSWCAPPTPTSRRTSRGRPSLVRASTRVMGDALEALRHRCRAGAPGDAGHRPGDLGAHRDARPRRRPTPSRGRHVGRVLPRRPPSPRATPSSPA